MDYVGAVRNQKHNFLIHVKFYALYICGRCNISLLMLESRNFAAKHPVDFDNFMRQK